MARLEKSGKFYLVKMPKMFVGSALFHFNKYQNFV